MKIALIGQKGITTHGGGVERHVEELARLFVLEGHRVFAYVRPQYTPRDIKTMNGIELIHVPTIKTKHLDAGIHSLLASIDVLFRDVDVINYQAIGPAFFSIIPRVFKPKAKIILTNHGIDWKRQKWGIGARIFLKLAERISAYAADAVICVSSATAQYYRDTYGINAIYIPNGVSVPTYRPNIEQLPHDLIANRYILFMARLVPEKGCHYLIEAFKRLDTDMHLVIAGSSSMTDTYVAHLMDMARSDDRIRFIGNVTGKTWADVFAGAYLFVQPSDLDATSFSILEAMSFGRAVLVSDIQDNRALIGKNGFTFSAANVDDLRDKLAYLIAHPDEVARVGTTARSYVLQRYDWERIASQFMLVYKKAMTSPHKREIFPRSFTRFYRRRVMPFLLKLKNIITLFLL